MDMKPMDYMLQTYRGIIFGIWSRPEGLSGVQNALDIGTVRYFIIMFKCLPWINKFDNLIKWFMFTYRIKLMIHIDLPVHMHTPFNYTCQGIVFLIYMSYHIYACMPSVNNHDKCQGLLFHTLDIIVVFAWGAFGCVGVCVGVVGEWWVGASK